MSVEVYTTVGSVVAIILTASHAVFSGAIAIR